MTEEICIYLGWPLWHLSNNTDERFRTRASHEQDQALSWSVVQ